MIPEYRLDPGASTEAHVGGLAVPVTVPIIFDEVRLDDAPAEAAGIGAQ